MESFLDALGQVYADHSAEMGLLDALKLVVPAFIAHRLARGRTREQQTELQRDRRKLALERALTEWEDFASSLREPPCGDPDKISYEGLPIPISIEAQALRRRAKAILDQRKAVQEAREAVPTPEDFALKLRDEMAKAPRADRAIRIARLNERHEEAHRFLEAVAQDASQRYEAAEREFLDRVAAFLVVIRDLVGAPLTADDAIQLRLSQRTNPQQQS